MIITTEVSIKITLRNKDYYSKLGYICNLGDIIKIKTEDLSPGSNIVLEISCDYCGCLLQVPYKRYVKNTSIVNKSSCSNKECSNQKIKDVCLKKYNVENPFQAEFVKKKAKNTLKKNHGVEHQMYLDEVKNKIKQTNQERYGVDSYTQTEEFKEKVKETNQERYGVDSYTQTEEFKQKVKETNLEKWGVEWTMQSKEVREKAIQTNLKKYGFETNLKSEDTKEKIKQTSLDKWGVDHPLKSKIIREKLKKTNIKRYGVDSYPKSDEYKEKTKRTNLEKWGTEYNTQSEEIRKNFNLCQDSNYLKYIGDNVSLFKCDKEHNFEISTSNYFNRIRNNTPLCTICYPINEQKSIKEMELYKFIQSIYSGEIIQSYRDGLEIDIYLPTLKIGFEFNGLYWHSDEFKDKNYHLDKTNYFKERGIRIIHIWEDNWDLKKDIIQSQIKNWVGINTQKIFARKCDVKIIDNKTARNFLDQNHIQGSYHQVKVPIGLYYENSLVSIMTFDQFEGRKKMKDGEWNLSRFCNQINTNVIGGASKLLSYFIKTYNPNRLVSYADRDWSIGSLYEKLQFKNINESSPDYKYLVDGTRNHKSKFRKKKGEIKTESERMKELNIHKIWDCGKIKYEKIIK